MKKLILIKLGGSIITDKSKPFCARETVIRRLAREIKQAKAKLPKDTQIIVGHGGGSYPHVPAKKYQVQLGVINKESLRGITEVQDAASRLNRLVVKEFLKIGLNVVSLNPSSFFITKNSKPQKAFLEPLIKFLQLGIVPIIYGDVVLDLKMGCTIISTEKILNFLTQRLRGQYKIEKIFYCGDTDGVYDDKGKTISQITPKNYQTIKKWIGGSDKTDVTGGMLHKVEESLSLARKLQIETMILSGKKPGNLKKALLNELKRGITIIKV